MPDYRQVCFERWGGNCEACGTSLAVQVHHIDGDRDNNDVENLMPLCATCHTLMETGLLMVDRDTRGITVHLTGLYTLTPGAAQPDHRVELNLKRFKDTIPNIWEVENNRPLPLFQDGVNGSFFTVCHVPAHVLAETLDLDAVSDPEDPESEDYKLNRELRTDTRVYAVMETDAFNGRPFFDLTIEWNPDYRSDQPLKVIGGQHRAKAIMTSVEREHQLERLHGIRVYFDLDIDKRAELYRISNTLIDISSALLDRITEQQLVGSTSRTWCQEAGLLEPQQDFADRVAGEDRFTVQLLRCLAVNFFRGQEFEDPIDESLHDRVYVPRSGGDVPDAEYKRMLETRPDIWPDQAFQEMGRSFAVLHRTQLQSCASALDRHRELRGIAFRYKAFTPAIAASWAYAAGLLQRDRARLNRLYALPTEYDRSTCPDPLNAKQMSVTRHETADEVTYRGLGTRQSLRDRQRLVELFLLVTLPEYRNTITKELLQAAVHSQVEKVQEREMERAIDQARRAAQRIQSDTG